MATNTGKGFRQGEQRDRSQFLNPLTQRWQKRNDTTGRIVNVRADGKPF